MTPETLQQLLSANDIDALITAVKKSRTPSEYANIKKQYDVKTHDVFDKITRKDKVIKDDNDAVKDVKNVARLGLPMQQKIVNSAAAFLCGNPIKLEATGKDASEKDFINVLGKVWDDNKLDYKSKKLAKLLFSETEVAELWYNPEAETGYWDNYQMKSKYKLRMKILANSYGDDLYPVFDGAGDMVLFGRGYKVADDAGALIENMDLYTTDKIIRNVKEGTGWVQTIENNTVGKIPIVYYSQPLPDWADVQPLISRLETKISNHADTNDYFDSPVLFIEGDPVSMPDKEEMGKMIQGERGAKAYYVTWNQAPESTKMEIENLWRFIHNCTDTPDISFESMKSLGNAPSGYAIELMFLSAHLKAADKAENFGESIQRRINYIKGWLASMDRAQVKYLPISIKPRFEYYMPENFSEKIDMINNAITGGILSTETGIRINPLVADADNEIEALNEQNSPANALDNLMGGGIIKPIGKQQQQPPTGT